jgi:hypothetical protein
MAGVGWPEWDEDECLGVLDPMQTSLFMPLDQTKLTSRISLVWD